MWSLQTAKFAKSVGHATRGSLHTCRKHSKSAKMAKQYLSLQLPPCTSGVDGGDVAIILLMVYHIIQSFLTSHVANLLLMKVRKRRKQSTLVDKYQIFGRIET